ncbi:MAG: helicase-associated domain-containing protein [Acidimicrobiales bacterium]
MELIWAAPNLTDPEVVAEALRAQPVMVEVLAASGGSVPLMNGDLRHLAVLVHSLDRIAHQLMMVMRVHGPLTRAQVLAQAPGVDPAELDRAARRLVVYGLAHLHGAELRLVDVLIRALEPPMMAFADEAADISSDRLAQALRRWGLPVPTTKALRLETLSAALRDRAQTTAMLDRLGPSAADAFQTVLAACTEPDAGPGFGVSTYALPKEWWPRYRYGQTSPIDALCDVLLLGSDWSRNEVFPWAETVTALLGSIFPNWSGAHQPATHPAPQTPSRVGEVVAVMGDLVGRCAANPPLGKLSGDRQAPVKVWRAAAKALGVVPELAEHLSALAVELGLLVPVLGASRGRGRTFTQDLHWQPDPVRLAAFNARSAAENWAAMVDVHRNPRLDPDPQARAENVLVLAILADLPDGAAVTAGELARYGALRHVLLSPSAVVARAVALTRLGVVAMDPPAFTGDEVGERTLVWLAPAGRALLDGPGAVDQLLGQGSAAFVVQPDHSVIAPADLRVELSQGLDRIARRHSEGGALVWRLDGPRLARHGAEVGVDAVLQFLREGSSVALPAAIERFVLDCVSQAVPLHVHSVGCVLTAADPAAVTQAARHKAAKLTVVAPGVAISPLTADKVRDVLAARGELLATAHGGPTALSLASSAADPLGSPLAPAQLASSWDVPHVPPGPPLVSGGPLLVGDGAVAAVAQQLLKPAKAPRKPRSR